LQIALILLLSQIASADDKIWDILSKQKDAEITLKEMPDGKTIRTAKFKSGVVFTETENGGAFASDNSGLGAVMCGWMTHSHISNLLQSCRPDSHPKLKGAYKKAVDRINDFIVLNSLTPVTKPEIEAAAKNMFDSERKNTPLDKLCTSEFLPESKEDIDDVALKKFEANIDNFLSMPRPPVAEPCL
jgi:hypothetical protein